MTFRHIFRFIAAAVFCAFVTFSTMVIGVLIGNKGHEAKAQFAAFIGVFHSDDTGEIIVALTGAPMALGCFLAPLAYGWALERIHRRPCRARGRGTTDAPTSRPGGVSSYRHPARASEASLIDFPVFSNFAEVASVALLVYVVVLAV